MKVEVEVKSIQKLNDYFFLVPDYQREYVWKADDHVEQFLEDISNEYDEKNKEQLNYFIGSIILIRNNGKHDVIDGQQRLTTITLTLCAFRDLIHEHQKALTETTLNEKHSDYLDTIKKLLFHFHV